VSPAWIIFRKEVRETLRDRKTLVIMVVLPLVLYPLLFLGLSQATLIQQGKLQAAPMTIALEGELAPGLAAAVAAEEATDVEPSEDARAAVREGRCQAGLRAKPGGATAFAAGGGLPVEVLFDGGSDASREAKRRVDEALERWTHEVVERRLRAKGLSRAYVEPVVAEAVDVAPPRRQGGWVLGQILPMLVSMLLIGAAFYPSVDLTAGEKERGTLQTLLTAPISPLSIVTGKYLAVVTLTLLSGGMNLLSLALVAGNIPLPDELAGGASFSVSPGAAAVLLLCLLLLGMMFAAAMMAVAVTARSFKEAQNYVTPLYMASLVPLMVAGLPGVELTATTAALPVTNLALTMKAALVGPVPVHLLLVVVGSSAAWVALGLVAATKVFQTESILLGDEGLRAALRAVAPAGRSAPSRGASRGGRLPSVSQAVTLLALVLLAMFYGSLAAQGMPLLAQVHLTQWGFLLVPTVLVVAVLGLDVRETLSLRRPPLWALGAGGLVGLGSWVAVSLVSKGWLPAPSPALEELSSQIVGLAADPTTAVLAFAGLAVAPAICEELLFRGVLLTALRRRMSDRAAVVLQAALFSAYHLNIFQALGTFLVGLVLGALVVRGRSLLPASLLHGLHNGLAVAAAAYAGEGLSGAWTAALLSFTVVGGILMAVGPRLERGARRTPNDAQRGS